MKSTIPSETPVSFSSLLPAITSAPPPPPENSNVGPAASTSPIASPKNSLNTRWIIVIKNAQTGNLHAVLNKQKGLGVLADFETIEEAVVAQGSVRACQHNESFIIPVEV